MTLEEYVRNQNEFANKMRYIQSVGEIPALKHMDACIKAMRSADKTIAILNSLDIPKVINYDALKWVSGAYGGKILDLESQLWMTNLQPFLSKVHSWTVAPPAIDFDLQLFGEDYDEDDEDLAESISASLSAAEPYLTPEFRTECTEVVQTKLPRKLSLSDILALISIVLWVIDALISQLPDPQLDKLIALQEAQLEQDAYYAELQHQDNLDLIAAIESNRLTLDQLNARYEELTAELSDPE